MRYSLNFVYSFFTSVAVGMIFYPIFLAGISIPDWLAPLVTPIGGLLGAFVYLLPNLVGGWIADDTDGDECLFCRNDCGPSRCGTAKICSSCLEKIATIIKQ